MKINLIMDESKLASIDQNEKQRFRTVQSAFSKNYSKNDGNEKITARNEK